MSGEYGEYLRDWALNLPEEYRTVSMRFYTDPSGGWWMAPLGTEEPDPDKPLSPVWIAITRDLEREERGL